ncbi:MAG: DNA repair protein RadC [Candidatus Eremiobacterota bacterium]
MLNKFNHYKMIKEESPGYRLNQKGPEVLKTSELIAIIISSGTNNKTAQKAAEKLLIKFSGNLTRLARATQRELSDNIPGIGHTRSSQLIAAFELGKRITSYSDIEKPSINTPPDVARLLMNEMRYYKKEVFKILLLDRKNKLIKIETISSGILDASLVHPREVFYPAIQELASRIILVHNHPSGNCTPSAQDIEITKNIIESGKILNIEVVDHIVIGDGKFLSLREKRII